MCFRNVGKTSVYQAISVFVEIHLNIELVVSSPIPNFIYTYISFVLAVFLGSGEDFDTILTPIYAKTA